MQNFRLWPRIFILVHPWFLEIVFAYLTLILLFFLLSWMIQMDYFALFQTFTVVQEHSHLHMKLFCIWKTKIYVGNTNKILQTERVHFTKPMKAVLYSVLLMSSFNTDTFKYKQRMLEKYHYYLTIWYFAQNITNKKKKLKMLEFILEWE